MAKMTRKHLSRSMDLTELFDKTLEMQGQIDQLRRQILETMKAQYTMTAALTPEQEVLPAQVAQPAVPEQDRYLSLKEAAHIMGYTKAYVQRLASESKLTKYQTGPRGRILFRRADIDAYMNRIRSNSDADLQESAQAALDAACAKRRERRERKRAAKWGAAALSASG